MKEFIRGRWVVEGFYCYHKESGWEFESEWREGRDVWKFGPNALTCFIDGKQDHSVTYVVVRGNVLVIDYSSMIPHFNRYIERYRIVQRGDEVWLYDLKTKIPEGFWLAIKLLPDE